MAQRILLAGGGTAGHIEPALAVADEIKRARPESICEFLGTDGALEQLLVPSRGYPLRTIKKVTLPRSLNAQTLFFPFRLIYSVLQAMKFLQGANLLIGFGGYVSAPAYLAAVIKRVPIMIHEANAKPGFANRLGRVFAAVIAVNFESVRREWSGAVLTGMPIRESISAINQLSDLKGFRSSQCSNWGFDPEKPIVAIFGGSQGSQHINQVVKEALAELQDIQIIHAVGINNELPKAQNGYLPLPYFQDMPAIYGAADLLITRSGAVTCSELAEVGKYAILVPLPHGNGEQITNAQALVDEGAALMIADAEFSASWLVGNIRQALDKAKLFKPQNLSRNKDAAKRLAELAFQEVDKNHA